MGTTRPYRLPYLLKPKTRTETARKAREFKRRKRKLLSYREKSKHRGTVELKIPLATFERWEIYAYNAGYETMGDMIRSAVHSISRRKEFKY